MNMTSFIICKAYVASSAQSGPSKPKVIEYQPFTLDNVANFSCCICLCAFEGNIVELMDGIR